MTNIPHRTKDALRRVLAAVVDANVRYTRIVHGDRALADRGAPPHSPRRAPNTRANRRVPG